MLPAVSKKGGNAVSEQVVDESEKSTRLLEIYALISQNKFPSIVGESSFLYELAWQKGYAPGSRAGVNAGCKRKGLYHKLCMRQPVLYQGEDLFFYPCPVVRILYHNERTVFTVESLSQFFHGEGDLVLFCSGPRLPFLRLRAGG